VRILITGVTGMAGSHLAEYLVQKEDLHIFGTLSMTDASIEAKVDPARLRPSDAKVLICDATKFKEYTGWQPQIPFEKTLKDLLNYWRERV
jgi:nucleoside-diphosphate-sugar epimerase